jgi:hypothetical protein
MHISDISAINCRADLTGICDGLLFLSLKTTTENPYRKMALASANKKVLLQP